MCNCARYFCRMCVPFSFCMQLNYATLHRAVSGKVAVNCHLSFISYCSCVLSFVCLASIWRYFLPFCVCSGDDLIKHKKNKWMLTNQCQVIQTNSRIICYFACSVLEKTWNLGCAYETINYAHVVRFKIYYKLEKFALNCRTKLYVADYLTLYRVAPKSGACM